MRDLELVKKAQAGDEKAFEELVKRYESQVAATVIGMLGRCDAADDVGQEVFIRFYKVMERYRGDANLGTYLTRIAINLSINELRRRKRRLSLFHKEEPEPPADVAHPDDAIQNSETRDMVEHAINKLETRFRAVVVLRLLDGYSTEETARILDVPLGTVLSRLSRAQQKLRELLTPYVKEEA